MATEQVDEIALAGFMPVSVDDASWCDRRSMRCHSRQVLEAFKASKHAAVAKDMPDEDLQREAYNLRNYRKMHPDEFGDVGISTRHGRLTLFRVV